LFVVLTAQALAFLLGLRGAHARAVFVALLLGHELAAVDAVLLTRLRLREGTSLHKQ